jgi:hypothetical protein
MIFCLIETAINKKRDPLVHAISKNATPHVNTKSSLEIFFHNIIKKKIFFYNNVEENLKLLSNCFDK